MESALMPRFSLIAAVILAVLLAACAETAAPTEEAEPTQTEETTPTPTEEPTPEATEEVEATEGAIPSFELPSSDAELEALLPGTIGNIEIQTFSMRGNEFMTSGEDNQEFIDFLERMGAQPEDVSVAGGFGFDAEDPTGGGAAIFAFRVV